MEGKDLLSAWVYEEKTLSTSCFICCCSVGIILLLTGTVLTALFRKITAAADIAMGGVALIVLGTVLIITGAFLGFNIFLSRQRLPKTSSAAKADVPPDPFSLVPVYPSSRPATKDVAAQILLLPGGVDPIYVTLGT